MFGVKEIQRGFGPLVHTYLLSAAANAVCQLYPVLAHLCHVVIAQPWPSLSKFGEALSLDLRSKQDLGIHRIVPQQSRMKHTDQDIVVPGRCPAAEG